MKLYSLAVNDREICSVSVECPPWMPVRPRVPKKWLSSIVARALQQQLVPTSTSNAWKYGAYWN